MAFSVWALPGKQASLKGPDLFTGGALGVETSIVSVIILSIADILLLRVAYQMRQFVSPRNESPAPLPS